MPCQAARFPIRASKDVRIVSFGFIFLQNILNLQREYRVGFGQVRVIVLSFVTSVLKSADFREELVTQEQRPHRIGPRRP